MSVTSLAAEALWQPRCLASNCSLPITKTKTVLVAIFCACVGGRGKCSAMVIPTPSTKWQNCGRRSIYKPKGDP
ncbi:hypothetical protein MHYP_G00215890 [Metynnis hypsauchen]